MSTGYAILLSALILAGLYLYKITRDRWKWSRIGRKGLVSFGSLILFMIIVFIGVFVFEKIRNWPHKQTAYEELNLGMTMAEVKYIKGYPPIVLEPPKYDEKLGGYLQMVVQKLPDGKIADDYFSWEFESSVARLDVDFDPKTKLVVRIGCFSKDVANCPPLLGLIDGSQESAVREQLGEPSSEKIEGVTKKMEYKNLGVWFFLVKQQVYDYGVRDFSVPDWHNEELK